jgi:hypothetical protein
MVGWWLSAFLASVRQSSNPSAAKKKTKQKNKGNVGGIRKPYFKLHYRAIVTKTAWYWHKKRHVDQWNRRPRNKPTQLQSLILNKGAKNILREKTACLTSGAGKTGYSHMKD